ncbi:hypothetical protein [Microbacterium capsulatum]|uniref:Peptidase S74 domain-containing protein n=1 Tax=Microbacterium capsulatum TaxID=3041921 RepID=A0ABU0XHX2_9MICO|nr:hypothetical protein [Microbacterium sp. ASV81]MDQ4214739.1 hypothetical protein [Microbacterium sp. ASV81]
MSTIDELVAIKEKVEAQWLAQPGVTGIDVGYKVVGGVQTEQIAIRVHVRKKRADVPEDQRVPAEIEGVVTDVLERSYEPQVLGKQLDVSLQADTTHYATLEGGISMGPSRAVGGYIFAGTLGVIVIDKTTGNRAALTNFHVACVDSGWSVGDRQVQPSRIDTGVVPTDEFGAIARATLSSAVDGAVITIDTGRATTAAIADIGTVMGTKAATLGMAVRKRGRTTGLTYGSVDGLALSVNIDYGDGIGVHTLTNQVSIAADTSRNPLFSDHGDSGSAIVDGSGYVVALLFAGAGTGTVGNPIASVLSELNIDIAVGKSIIKDIKDGHKDIFKDKDKELRKDILKDKELRKDLIKDKELRKDLIKDKELLTDGKGLKDIRDIHKRVPDNIPFDPGGPVENPGGAGSGEFAARLAELEERLEQLVSFVSPELRPDLSTSALGAEADLSAEALSGLRAEAERQAAEAAATKADLDNLGM